METTLEGVKHPRKWGIALGLIRPGYRQQLNMFLTNVETIYFHCTPKIILRVELTPEGGETSKMRTSKKLDRVYG